MEEVSIISHGDDNLNLPPGFRFHPTDEEIITHYLSEKVLNSSFTAKAIGEVDLNKCEPWDLPERAKMGEKEWYFFCQRDRKYPTGTRTNRATQAGYWKATGKDKEIHREKGYLVGMKKTLVFYRGRAPKGEKTNWVMHEYRLEGKMSYYNLPKAAKDEWVVCRVFHKNTGIKKSPSSGMMRMNSFEEDLIDFSSLPPLMDPSYTSNLHYSPLNEEKCDFPGSARAATSYMKSVENQQDHKSYMPSNHNEHQGNLMLYPRMPIPNPRLLLQRSTESLGHLHHLSTNVSTTPSFPGAGWNFPDHHSSARGLANMTNQGNLYGLTKQCKVEQSSNQSIVSQETGPSTDVNMEISSRVPKDDQTRGTKSYHDIFDQDHLSGEGPVDLDSLWTY